MLTDKRVLITGGTGSIGHVLVRRLLAGEFGRPKELVVFSRDEAKQHAMRLMLENRPVATDDAMYASSTPVRFHIGSVDDYAGVCRAMRNIDVVFHAAALKQVPTCEYFPTEAVKTNVQGATNVVRAIRDHNFPVEAVVGISTDKACKPVNVMGMTKAIQERIFVQANLDCPNTRFIVARYGNVLASRGSVLPVFHEQINTGGPVTITSPEMTRFLMSLDQAVDTILAALQWANRGETYIPHVPAVRIIDIVDALIGDRHIDKKIVGTRPGEKLHELLVNEEEGQRTVHRGDYLAILPALPQLRTELADPPYEGLEYSSSDNLLSLEEVVGLLQQHRLLIEHHPVFTKA